MYEIKKAVTMNSYDLIVNGIHVLRDSKQAVEDFVEGKVKPLGLEQRTS
jgi:hypothetical protein